MTLLRNLFFLLAVTVFALASTVLCLFNYNPFKSDLPIFINFYASLFLALAGILAIVIYFLKTKLIKNNVGVILFWPSVRQGLLVSLALTTLLALKGLKILDWLIAISALIIAVLFELFFQTKRKTK